jgi:hypothetical protein
VAGSYNNVTANVTDFKSNTGTQGFGLQINQATPTTGVMSSANPSVFQQSVTFTVTVASSPASSCVPTGTVNLYDGANQIASNLPLNGVGVATFTTNALSVGGHTITASYSGDPNFKSSNGALSPSATQTVNQASTLINNASASPSPAFVGQPITVSFNFSVVGPGAGAPTPPSGSITVVASDSSTCAVAASVALLSGGKCTLSPAPTGPTTPGNPITYTITYLTDANFVGSGGGGNYPVDQLVFTTQPSNTGVGLTITPAVVVTAEDGSSNPLDGNGGRINFTGGITLAIGSGPGTLSGTLTQNAVAGVATFNDLSINRVATGDTLTASVDGVNVSATSNAFNITGTYYVDSQGNFGTLNLATAAVTQIGAGTAAGAGGMDLTPTGQIYTYVANQPSPPAVVQQLLQINPSTGAATVVGPGTLPNPGLTTTGGLTTGAYFAIDGINRNLYSINLATGATTLIGPTTTAVYPPDQTCSFQTIMAGSANVLYYSIGFGNRQNTICSQPMPDTLYQVDPTSGATTLIGPITGVINGANRLVGGAFVGSTLYGFAYDGNEYTINLTTGAATQVGNTGTSIFGAAGIAP